MRLHVLGSYGGEAPGCRQTSLLIDGSLLLDAGSVTAALSLGALTAIDHVLITHAHLDHCAALAFMADSLFGVRIRPIEVWSIPPVIRQLRTHVFNGTIWPDFTRLPSPQHPILSFHEIQEGQQQRVGKHEVLAVRVHHTVDAAGYLVSDGKASVLFGGDTGPTTELWEVANGAAGLQAILVEASYPNKLEDLANASGHLTPHLLGSELKKLKVNAPIYAQHIKPQYAEEVLLELTTLADPPVTPLEQAKKYVFVAP